MDIIKWSVFGLASTIVGCSLATAGDMGPITTSQGLRPVVSLQAGYASINIGNGTQRFTGTDSDLFTYNNSGSRKNTGVIGVFLGAEHALPLISHPGFFMQTGVEYNYFGSAAVTGINTVGIEPQTSTTYSYHYNVQTQQVLGTFRILATAYERFHPYGEVGLGAAFNRAGQYNASTTETGGINLTPEFSNQNNTQFSYVLGLGVDTNVNTNIRLGLGYRYSNFGSSTLGNGTVTFNNYHAPVSFALGGSNNYVNQLMVRISYTA